MTSKKSKVPFKKAKITQAMVRPDKLSVSRKVIEFLKMFTIYYSGKIPRAPRIDWIMPPWTLPRPKRRIGRVIDTLIPSRQTPKLRKKDIRKVIKGRSKPITIIIMEDC